MDSCHLSITVIQNQIIIVGSPVLWVCFLSITPSSFRLFNLPTLVLQIRQLPFAFLVDLEINLFSFLKSWWNFSTCFKGIVWFHSSAHVRAMTLARSILLFMKQSEASWCLKREIFVVSRENAVIEVMFLIIISFLSFDSRAPFNFIIYEPILCEFKTCARVWKKSSKIDIQ